VKHSDKPHQKFKDTRLEHAFNWQKQHFKSFEAAYRTSPFFEYFEDDIRPLFEKKHEFMMDLNFEAMEIVTSCLGMDFSYAKTAEYFHEVQGVQDYRHLVNGKKDTAQFEPYTQVFEEKHSYINNLSILDLLFNEGRYAMEYLKNQEL
jgi:hypothetical protein